jgi:magnesium-transporting ATPase (P-type)
MLTGDHKATATAIAIQVGIIDESHPPHAVMTGPQFDKMSEDEIDALPELPLVIARCAPETKGTPFSGFQLAADTLQSGWSRLFIVAKH